MPFMRPPPTRANSELFCTNVVLGVRDALNELLRSDLLASATVPGIRVEIESQARIGGGQHACVDTASSGRRSSQFLLRENIDVDLGTYGRSALDFVLSLVSWPFTATENAFRFHLVSVEMKASSRFVLARATDRQY